ncbi:unnamed protein product [Adineta steineri]|uniref:NHL repeat containing protein n=1 Tax=Adineta steineri TaxID=433720 RepID=A0A818ZEQ6_9BILA|nr:unnamed protein product [Adineta steineri]
MDLTKHRQLLNEELHLIINDYDQFKQRFGEQKPSPHDLSLLDQINQWEINSIDKIKQRAKNCREIVTELLQTCINDTEMKFNDLNEQLKQFHSDNEFNEINLNYLRNELIKIREELHNPSNISIQQDSRPFINEISIISLEKKSNCSKSKQNTTTVAAGNEEGQQLDQLNRPKEIVIDKNKNIFIADWLNHRIFHLNPNPKEGKIIAGGNGQGNRMDQLNNPTDVIVDQQNQPIIIADQGNRRVIRWLNQSQQVLIGNIDCHGLAMDKNGFLYVSDREKNEVRRWKMGEYNEGVIVAGGNGQGNQFNQLNHPTFIFVDEDQSVYVSDWNNHRVMKWRKDAKEGTIIAGGNLNQLSKPRGVIIDHFGRIGVGDRGNHRVMHSCEGKEAGEIVVGENGAGNQSNKQNCPDHLSFDDDGNLYFVKPGNDRMQKMKIIL